MLIDNTTFSDLSIFNAEDEFSLFDKLDLTRTTGGRDKMKKLFLQPLHSIKEVRDTQEILKLMIEKESLWPVAISNGSVMMIYKFYESAVDTIPAIPSPVSAYSYKLLHGPDFSMVKYSAGHAFDFLKGFEVIMAQFNKSGYPQPLVSKLERAKRIMDKPQLKVVFSNDHLSGMGMPQMLAFAAFIRYHFKQLFYELMEIYSLLDAWYGMAMAVKKFQFIFPEFIESDEPVLEARDLYHALLPTPVPYDVILNKEKNFVFLTGANMAGKSTFIKSVGTALFLAHTGMGVPAVSMKVSLFDGLLTNINVKDNLIKGESFFYNEVMRIKNTILKVTDHRKWLVLIDELFKGTNIEDAMKCSIAVVKGLVKVEKSLFILSTHLYEISEDLKDVKNIDFKYFQTDIVGDQLEFNYQLRDGVSNDRLGYFILQSEGVTDLLDNI